MAAAPEEVVKLLSRKPREMPSGVAKAKVAMTDQNCRVPASESTMLDPRAYAANPLCACARRNFVTLFFVCLRRRALACRQRSSVPCALAQVSTLVKSCSLISCRSSRWLNGFSWTAQPLGGKCPVWRQA